MNKVSASTPGTLAAVLLLFSALLDPVVTVVVAVAALLGLVGWEWLRRKHAAPPLR
jgi:hypothetical protein